MHPATLPFEVIAEELEALGIETQRKNPEPPNAQANGKLARPGHGRHGVDA
jgi:hypothetical protein